MSFIKVCLLVMFYTSTMLAQVSSFEIAKNFWTDNTLIVYPSFQVSGKWEQERIELPFASMKESRAGDNLQRYANAFHDQPDNMAYHSVFIKSFMVNIKNSLRLGTTGYGSFELVSSDKDQDGNQTYRFRQLLTEDQEGDEDDVNLPVFINGEKIPVIGGEIVVGAKEGVLLYINSKAMPVQGGKTQDGGLDRSLSVSEQEAKELVFEELLQKAQAQFGPDFIFTQADVQFQKMTLAVYHLKKTKVEDGVSKIYLKPMLVWVVAAQYNTMAEKYYVAANGDGLEDESDQKSSKSSNGQKGSLILKRTPLSAHLNNPITIYNGKKVIVPLAQKGSKIIENGQYVGGPFNSGVKQNGLQAYGVFNDVMNFYAHHFKMNSYDNKGARVEASIQMGAGIFSLMKGMFKQNAAWVGGGFNYFIIGADGPMLKGLERATDVLGHEYTHAIIDSTSKLEYEGESGALNEHLADVFGEIIEMDYGRADGLFSVGESVLTHKAKFNSDGTKKLNEMKLDFIALRNMLDPHKGLSAQPKKMSELKTEPLFVDYDPSTCLPDQDNDNCGVHVLSGIPNRIVARFIQVQGRMPVAKMVYRVMTARLRSTSNFKDYKMQMLDECKGQKLNQCSKLALYFKEAGI